MQALPCKYHPANITQIAKPKDFPEKNLPKKFRTNITNLNYDCPNYYHNDSPHS